MKTTTTIVASCIALLFVAASADARSRERSPVRSAAAAKAEAVIKGYAAVEAFDQSSGRVVLNGERYSVTYKTRLEDEYGGTAKRRDFQPAQTHGPLVDADSGSKVYFEVDRKTGNVRLMRLVKEIPS